MGSGKQIEETVEKLRRNRFDAMPVGTIEEAVKEILAIVSVQATVGVANSVTIRQLGIVKKLQ